jgi:hypothetical protein
VLALMLSIGGCASLTYQAVVSGVEQNLASNHPGAALALLNKASPPNDDRVLYSLDRGMVLRMLGRYRESNAAFEKAKRLMGKYRAISISETAAALTLSENLTSYSGDLYEHLLVHVYEGLNYLQMQDPDSARVEAQQIDILLNRVAPDTGRAPHGGDGFARYLSGIIYEANHQYSDAMIAYRKAWQAYRAERAPVPRDLEDCLLRLSAHLGLADEHRQWQRRFGDGPWHDFDQVRRSAQVVLVFSDGLAPARGQSSVTAQSPENGRIYRIALPVAIPRHPASRGAMLHAGTDASRTARVENVAEVSVRTLAAKIPLLTARALARNVARDRMVREADKHDEGVGALLNFIGVVTEQADTRSWRTLPDNIQLARLYLEPGKYPLRADILGVGGRVLDQHDYGTVSVDAGDIDVLGLHWITYGSAGATGRQAIGRLP